jgi:hypothetical protein
VVYTTFHFPESGANVITTDSDWATNCPEYKVTAEVVKVFQPSEWQKRYQSFSDEQRRLLDERRQAQGKERRRYADEQRQPGEDGQSPTTSTASRTDKAVQGVRQHLQSFWTPAMRRQLGSGSRPMRGRA